MTKLIRDIIPSREVETEKNKEAELKKLPQKRKGFNWRLSLGILALLIIGGMVYQIGFSSFHLTVYPQTQLVSLEKEILVAVNEEAIGEPGVIQGKFLTDSREESEIFPATGQTSKGQKAEGIVKVYNAYRPAQAITLRPMTRFLSSSGKYFQVPEELYLPAAHWEGGKLIPSVVETRVVAMEAGPDYNIDSDEFSVPGLAGSLYYDYIHAQSSSAMTGGSLAAVAQVTEEDLQLARESLKENLFAQSATVLQEEAGSTFIFLPAALSQEIVEGSSSVEAGEEVENFDYQLSITSQALVFSEEKVIELIKEEIQEKVGPEKEIVPDSLTITYYPLAVNFDRQIIDCNLKATAKVYPVFSQGDLKELIAGQRIGEVQTIIRESFPQFEEIQGHIKPFWTRKVPADFSRIEVEVYLDY
jgi:hypothetical protein